MKPDTGTRVRKPLVLVVDDEEQVRKLVRRGLEQSQYRVAEAVDAEEAETLLQQESVELVISDVCMPGKSGIDLLGGLTRRQPEVPVIMITGQPSVRAAVDCMKIGASDYLTKPVSVTHLVSVVESALADARRGRLGIPSSVRMAINEELGYHIVRRIGVGGMGIVFLVREGEKDRGRDVALKLLKPEILEGESENRRKAFTRFLREAKLAGDVHHPAIVEIYGHGLVGREQVPYIAMEYIRGTSLSNWMRRDPPLSYREKTHILRQVADALAALHEAGICHRDIKPDNILVDSSLRAKLTDFGIARPPVSELTATEELLGTPRYCAPEGFASTFTPASDIFSFGAVAYEFLIGKQAFPAENLAELVEQVRSDPPREPRKLQPDFPEELQDALARMLRKKPADRYADAREIVQDLEAYLLETPRKARRRSLWERFTPPKTNADWR